VKQAAGVREPGRWINTPPPGRRLRLLGRSFTAEERLRGWVPFPTVSWGT
jgi:hypothetical protein